MRCTRRSSAVWLERGVPEVQPASVGRRGLVQRVARLRVALGFTCGVLVLWLATPTRMTIAAGLALALAGEAFRFWAAGHLNKSREVTRSGPYRFVAHPLYVGSSVIGAGLAVASGRVAVAVVVAAYLAVTLTAAIRSEEAFLRGVFGGDYDAYKRAGVVDTATRFSLPRALANREHRAVAGLLAALLLMAWKATYNGAF
jgi:protein-S-isoprenylcysteine O-methyltransferase Ste14